jgi:hypothetical protein
VIYPGNIEQKIGFGKFRKMLHILLTLVFDFVFRTVYSPKNQRATFAAYGSGKQLLM